VSARLERIRALVDEDSEWSEDDRAVPMQVVGEVHDRPSYLFLTKVTAFDQLYGIQKLPESWGLMGRYGLPCAEVSSTARRLVASAERLHFFGDLDPLDLTVFLELRDQVDSRMRLVGVSDAWLQSLNSNSLAPLTIKMTAFEAEHWKTLKVSDPAIVDLVGERSSALLDGGSKIEIEGALNAALHGPNHDVAIRELLFGVA
jgi:hypothetical protein